MSCSGRVQPRPQEAAPRLRAGGMRGRGGAGGSCHPWSDHRDKREAPAPLHSGASMQSVVSLPICRAGGTASVGPTRGSWGGSGALGAALGLFSLRTAGAEAAGMSEAFPCSVASWGCCCWRGAFPKLGLHPIGSHHKITAWRQQCWQGEGAMLGDL